MKRIHLLAVFGAAALCVTGAALFAMRSRATVFALKEPGSLQTDPMVVIFNPFRDRTPERRAVALLAALKDGDMENANRLLERVRPGLAKATIESESTWRVRDWTLVERADSADRSKLTFRVHRHGTDTPSLVWIEVTTAHSGGAVTSFETFY